MSPVAFPDVLAENQQQLPTAVLLLLGVGFGYVQIRQPIKGRLGRTIKKLQYLQRPKRLNNAFADFVHSIISTSPIGQKNLTGKNKHPLITDISTITRGCFYLFVGKGTELQLIFLVFCFLTGANIQNIRLFQKIALF